VRYPWQFGLAILSVALGNTIVASIDLASDNAHRAFLRSTKTLTGRTTHRITGDPSSVLEEVFRRLYLELGGARSATPPVGGEAGALDRSGLAPCILGGESVIAGSFRPWITGASDDNAGLDRTPSA
jgi:putative ABC transport system permease protein